MRTTPPRVSSYHSCIFSHCFHLSEPTTYLHMIDGLVRLMQSPDDVTGPLNIGNPEEFTMRELATLTIDLIGSRSKIVHRPLPQDDPRQRRPEISRAAELLGWTPRTPLRQGLEKTIAYFEQLFCSALPHHRDPA
jgi:UDP-glucuronate decarboxylase